MNEVVSGNPDAFDELVKRHHQRILRLARMLTRGDLDAEDLVQETFVRAYRALDRFRGDSTFRTWVQRIAVNVINSHLAHRHRRVSTQPLWSDIDGTEPAVAGLTSCEDIEITFLRRRMIDRALASLSEDARRLVVLRDEQGFAYHEIAAIVCLPMGTVESRIFRARRRLRPLLAPLMARYDRKS